jgi:hypothetical protein
VSFAGVSGARARRRAVTGLLALACWALAAPALAMPPLHGAVDGRALFGFSNRHGGSLGLDLWLGKGIFRFGATLGVGAVSKDEQVTSRVFTPLGLSAALLPREDSSGPTGVLRGGMYAGAQKSGLIVGPFASAAVGYRFALGEGASLRLGADLWALFMHNGSDAGAIKRGLFLGPYLGLGF